MFLGSLGQSESLRWMVMLTPSLLQDYFQQYLESKHSPLLLARDHSSDTGWRRWTSEDDEALCDWLAEKVRAGVIGTSQITCYNLKEVAALLGVSVPKVQTWLRRQDHPLPHIRDGRIIMVPDFLLKDWLKSEAAKPKPR